MNLQQGYIELLQVIFPETSPKVIEPVAIKQLLDGFISELAPKDQQVVKLRFGLIDGSGKTLQQIGDVLGVTRERVRQLEKRALRRLKHPVRSNKIRQFVDLPAGRQG